MGFLTLTYSHTLHTYTDWHDVNLISSPPYSLTHRLHPLLFYSLFASIRRRGKKLFTLEQTRGRFTLVTSFIIGFRFILNHFNNNASRVSLLLVIFISLILLPLIRNWLGRTS